MKVTQYPFNNFDAMKNIGKIVKAAFCATVIIGTGLTANAQSVQEKSVWAPANVKVDAKLDEWDNSLEANNKTVDISYTMANDDKNLYLAMKSNDQGVASKIVGGGITITINTADKKKEDNACQLHYPVVNRSSMRSSFRRGGNNGGAQEQPDSATIANMRAQLLASAKEITVKGFKNITDSVISIYNEYSIKVAIGYDQNGALIYELAVPLSQLGISPGKTKQIAYNIKVNGVNFTRNRERESNGGGNYGGFGGRGGNRGFGGGGRGGRGGFSGMDFQSMLSDTDFWGKYTLAVKK